MLLVSIHTGNLHISIIITIDNSDFSILLEKNVTTCRVRHSCVVFLLFIVEQKASIAGFEKPLKQPLLDLNFTTALAQLFFEKVAFYVGGHISMESYERQNPQWEDIVRVFPFDGLLRCLKGGEKTTLDELKEKKEFVSDLCY